MATLTACCHMSVTRIFRPYLLSIYLPNVFSWSLMYNYIINIVSQRVHRDFIWKIRPNNKVVYLTSSQHPRRVCVPQPAATPPPPPHLLLLLMPFTRRVINFRRLLTHATHTRLNNKNKTNIIMTIML